MPTAPIYFDECHVLFHLYGHCQADRNAKQAKNKMQPAEFEPTAANSTDGQF